MIIIRMLIIGFLLFATASGAAGTDVKGSKDHPMFPRFEGAEIIGHKATDYDEFTMALGKAYEHASSDYRLKKSNRVEGRVTRTLYLIPPGKTTLQVLRNYEKTLQGFGFKPLFACTNNSECGWYAWFTVAPTLGGLRDYALQLGDDYRYLAAHLPRKEGDVYVSLLVYKYSSSVVGAWKGRTMAELNVIEIEPMKEEMVFVKAEDLAKGIAEEGHAAVHQIHFDTDSDVIKPDSRPAIEEIAKLLKGDPGLKIIFVGHTDSQGDLQHNMELSQRRAKAVMTAMEAEYGIERERLGAAGLGYLAPVAPTAPRRREPETGVWRSSSNE